MAKTRSRKARKARRSPARPLGGPLQSVPGIVAAALLTTALAVCWPSDVGLGAVAAFLAFWVASALRGAGHVLEIDGLVIGAIVAGLAVWLAAPWLPLLVTGVLVLRTFEVLHVGKGAALWYPFSRQLYGVHVPVAKQRKPRAATRPAVPLPRRSAKEFAADAANRLPGTTRALLKQVSGDCLAGECGSCDGTGCAHGCGHAAAARRKHSNREQVRRAVGAGVPAGGYSFDDAIGRDIPPF